MNTNDTLGVYDELLQAADEEVPSWLANCIDEYEPENNPTLNPDDESISTRVDDLCCGVSTVRDRNGVVGVGVFDKLNKLEKEVISEGRLYGGDEVYNNRIWNIKLLNLDSVRYGRVNSKLVRETTGVEWRSLVMSGLPVKDALSGVLFEAMASEIKKLPRHLFFVLWQQPDVIPTACQDIINAFAEYHPLDD